MQISVNCGKMASYVFAVVNLPMGSLVLLLFSNFRCALNECKKSFTAYDLKIIKEL